MLSNAFHRLCLVKRGKRILFLLGAGASIPAGYPTTEEISKHLLSAKDTPHAVDLAKDVYRQFAGIPSVNYEDVFNRIYKFYEECNEENSVYYDSLGVIKNSIIKLIKKRKPEINNIKDKDSEILSTLDNTLDYISNITRGKIYASKGESPIDDVKHLSLFSDFLSDDYHLDIFTLNHDTLLEDYFNYCDIEFIDGFEKINNSYGEWNSAQFNVVGQVRIFKLHGSVDWFRVSYPGEQELTSAPWGPELAISTRMNIFLAKIDNPERAIESCWKARKNGQDVKIEDKSGVFLVGTQNKYYSYAVDPFLTLLCKFNHGLHEQGRVIIIGYGFGDDAINNIISNWQSKAPTSRQVCYIGYSKGNEKKSCEEMSQSDVMIEASKGRVRISKCSFAGIQSEDASRTIQEFLSN